jgi:hypothetical protein
VEGPDLSFQVKARFALLSRPALHKSQLFVQLRNRGRESRKPRHGFEQMSVSFRWRKIEGGSNLVRDLAGSFDREPPRLALPGACAASYKGSTPQLAVDFEGIVPGDRQRFGEGTPRFCKGAADDLGKPAHP